MRGVIFRNTVILTLEAITARLRPPPVGAPSSLLFRLAVSLLEATTLVASAALLAIVTDFPADTCS